MSDHSQRGLARRDLIARYSIGGGTALYASITETIQALKTSVPAATRKIVIAFTDGEDSCHDSATFNAGETSACIKMACQMG